MVEQEPAAPSAPDASGKAKERRDIPGNFPYTTSPGVFSKVLARLISSERPGQFTQDYLATVLQAPGGSGRPIIPILKRMGLLSSDGKPADRYGRFQSEGGRASAALEALRAGWPELFKRNTYAHKLDKGAVDDLFEEITGLTKNDQVFRAISATFDAVRQYAKDAREASGPVEAAVAATSGTDEVRAQRPGSSLSLSNQINIILPETTDINVYNAIFRSIKENIL